MRKTLIILFVLLFVSCERKPLYLAGDFALDIHLTVDEGIETLWNGAWKDSLVYKWDENIHGKIGYTSPENLTLLVFNNNRILSETPVVTNSYNKLNIVLGKEYDILIYNKNWIIDEYYENGSYYIETQEHWSTRAINKISERYTTVYQPDEIFSYYIKNIYLSDNMDDYELVYDNRRNVYVYNINASLKPVSYIYIVQIIVINDDGTEIEAESINSFTIGGISNKKDLFTNAPKNNGLVQIYSDDIKDPQETDCGIVFASRVTVLDVSPDDESSSWHSSDHSKYYINLSINTHHYGEVCGTKDISNEINNNKKGGIITVRIKNSDLKTGEGDDDGFGISVGEWENHIIDIPF